MRTVVLTGVSRGLGEALFTQLNERGDAILAIGRRFTPAQESAAASSNGRIRLHHADLSEPDQVPGAEVLAAFLAGPQAGSGPLALVHNAAVVEPIGSVGQLSSAEVQRAVTVNLVAPMLLTNAFLTARAGRRPARLVFISSGAAHRVVGGWAVYSATKRGAEMFFEAVADEYRDDPGLRVATVNPGVMDTSMQAAIRAAATSSGYFPDRDRYLALHERGELPDPAGVARRIIVEQLD